MKSLFSFRLFGSAPEDGEALPSAPTDSAAQVFPAVSPTLDAASSIHLADAASTAHLHSAQDDDGEETYHQSPLLKTIAWVSAGMGAVALGVIVGRELRIRYKFNRRTPYDFYEHAGDEHDLEFGVGI